MFVPCYALERERERERSDEVVAGFTVGWTLWPCGNSTHHRAHNAFVYPDAQLLSPVKFIPLGSWWVRGIEINEDLINYLEFLTNLHAPATLHRKI